METQLDREKIARTKTILCPFIDVRTAK